MLEALSSVGKGGFQSVMSFLMTRRMERKAAMDRDMYRYRLPCRVSGEELSALETEFGWKLEIVDRGPTMAPYTVARHYCLDQLNRRIKHWDGEEVIEFDRDMMSMAVKQEGWLHSCRTYATSRIAAGYSQQEAALLKAIEGKRPDISASAASLLKEVRSGGGAKVCLDASRCSRVVDTLLVDLSRTDISAYQAAATVAQHQAARMKLWFYFEVEMLVQDEGELSASGGRYYIDRDRDLVNIFPEKQSIVTYSYSFSNMLSYVMESDVEYNGVKYLIEIHDSKLGASFALLSPVEVEPEYDTECETRFYRPSGEALTVVEHWWDPPLRDWTCTDVRGVHTKLVVPTKMVEGVRARLLSFPVEKMTIANARLAVRDFSGGEITRGAVTTVQRRLPAHYPESLAQAMLKRALCDRAQMEVEQMLLHGFKGLMSGNVKGWINHAVHVAWKGAVDVVEAVAQIPGCWLRGDKVQEDYGVEVRELDAGYVIRNIVRAKSGLLGFRVASFMPGGIRFGSTLSSASTVDYVLSRARAACAGGSSDDDDGVVGSGVQVEPEEKVRSGCVADEGVQEEWSDARTYHRMDADREKLVEKMRDCFDAQTVVNGSKEVEGRVVVQEPACTEEAVGDGAVQMIHDDYFRIFPSLKGVDVQVRAHLLSAEDRFYSLQTPMVSRNVLLDGLAPTMRVRRSKLLTAGGGRRPRTQHEAVAAISKRIANAPRADFPRDFDRVIDSEFQRVVDVAFRKDWKSLVKKRCLEGLWQPRLAELRRNVTKLDTQKVTAMLRESWCRGEIDLTRWKAMVKPDPKPLMSAEAETVLKPTQTIVYLESKMTNSYYSSMLTEAHDVLDELLRPEVRVNVRRDRGDQERWFNSFQVRRSTAGGALFRCETDISQCDKSHTLFNLLTYFRFLQSIGAPDEVIGIWEVMAGLKTASAGMVGVMLQFIEQLTSGGWHTISFNSIVNFVATVNALDLQREDLVTLQVTGDDGLVESLRRLDVVAASEHYRGVYNFESKTFEATSFPYFCGHYYVFVDGYWFMTKDPIKTAESMGRYVSAVASVKELHVSYLDNMKHYDKKEVLDALAVLVALRNRYAVVPRALVRGLSCLRKWEVFEELFCSEVSELNA